MNGSPTGSASRIPAVTPEDFLRRDAELLASGDVAVHVALLSGAAVSIGVSQPDSAECAQRARRIGIPVIRRSTGGLGLWHGPQDIVWSLVLPRTDPRVGRDFARAYGRLGAGVVRFLRAYGIEAQWAPPGHGPGEYCLLSGAGDVLRVAGRAIGGASQHLTGTALLHHGVLPYIVDSERLAELFGLSAEVTRSKLVGLAEALSGRPPLELAEELERALRDQVAPDR